ncbi:translocation/assembly module TamB domain-containing protein [Psychromarinibacter sp. C21-152]|uniref:Translocation/assembly module TamB domain-containing protein n=1 Tax=Psychromarinibacter sediminicola TaxID=3033385 RepID=A0AAE3NQX4_9RHOB|nr:translocation/assembly module TamB domain-containing protein [Psychromarinibacter sediminicola]MDF0600431.1 translocation/assembly module TamB domain-containing protein [Psychromarinibacter sediminicola]
MRLLAVLLVLLPGLALAQTTEEEERDRGILQAFLEDNLSDAGRTVRIDGFEGALSSRATLDRLSIADDQGTWLILEGAVLDWNRSAILRGEVQVNELSAERLVLTRLPATEADAPSPEAPGFSLPDLPVSIDIATLRIARAEIGAPVLGEDVVLRLEGSAALSGGSGQTQLSIERLDGPEGRISVAGAYDAGSGDLDLSLDFREAPGGIAASLLGLPGEPAVEFTVEGDGTIDDFTAQILLVTDGTTRAEGTVTLGAETAGEDGATDRRFAADITGDIAPLLLPDYRDFLGDRVALDVSGVAHADGRLTLEELALETRAMSLSGALALDGDQWPVRIDLAGQIASPTGREVLLPLAGPRTYVRGLDLSVQYDAADDDAWTAAIEVAGLRRWDLAVERTALTGEGRIVPGEGASVGRADGRLELDISGIAPADAELARALGDRITGAMAFAYTEDAPLDLSDLSLGGSDYRLTGSATVAGLRDDLDLGIDATVGLAAEDLSRFAGLAGLDLAGAAELQIAGSVAPLAGAFDLTLDGETTDLGLGIAALDPLIGGQGQLDAALARDEDGFTVDRFAITTPETRLTASADLASGAGTARFDLSLRDGGVVAEGLDGPVSATGTASQTGDDWTISARLEGPGGAAAQVDGTVALPDGAPGAVTGIAEVGIDSLSPYAALAGRDLGGALDVTVAGRGDLAERSFEVSVTGTAQDLALGVAPVDRLLQGETTLTADVASTGAGEITFDGARFETPQLTATLAGSVGPAQGRVGFDARLADVGLFVDELSGPATLRGVATRSGGDWRLQSGFSAPGGAGGTVDATLAMGPDGPRRVSGTAEAAVPDLAPYSDLAGRSLAGGVDLTVTGGVDLTDRSAEATLDGTATDLALGIAPVDRLLAGETALSASLSRAADGLLTLSSAKIANDQLTVTAAGTVGADSADLTLEAALTSLGTLDARVSGAATLQGSVTRDGDDWRAQAGFSGPGGAAGSVNATLAVPGGTPGAATLTLEARFDDLAPYSALAGVALDGALSVTAEAEGDLSDLTGRADISAEGDGLGVGLAMVDPLLRGDSALELELRRTEAGDVVFDRADFRSGLMTADLTGRVGPDGGTAEYDIRIADIGPFGTGLSGAATARGSLRSDGGGWQVNSALTGPGGIAADVSGRLSQDFARADLSIGGNAPLELANRFIRPNLIAGRADFRLSLNGPLALSSLSGTVSTSGAGFTLPALRLRLTDLGATLSLSGGRASLNAGAAVATGGRVEASGTVGLSAPFSGDITAQLIGVNVEEPGLYETSVDGRVTVSGPLSGGATIGGRLQLGTVEIRIPSSGGLVSGDLPELKHIAEPAAVRQTRVYAGKLGTAGGGGGGSGGPVYGLDIVVDAPNQIFVRGRGLDAELGGQLRLSGSTANVVTAGGFDLIRGRLDLLGERLTLTEGSARLQGDFDPFIRLVATTVSGDITVRIEISGFASAPELTVTSEPDLPEEEVLAQLLFERPLSDISALQAVQLANAVRTLAGGGGDGIVGRLRSSFGLDDLDVTTNEEGDVAVEAGKYISDNVYTGVTVDSQGRSEINLNLQVTPSITARGSASSDGETGIGVFFERDY